MIVEAKHIYENDLNHLIYTGTYEDDRDNGKDHDCVALLCRFLRLHSGPTSFANIGMLLLQIKQMVQLSESAGIKSLVTIWIRTASYVLDA